MNFTLFCHSCGVIHEPIKCNFHDYRTDVDWDYLERLGLIIPRSKFGGINEG